MIIAWGFLIWAVIYFFISLKKQRELVKLFGENYWYREEYQYLVSTWRSSIPYVLALFSIQYLWG